jgi:hypothetical protein
MKAMTLVVNAPLWLSLGAAALLVAGCAGMSGKRPATLSGTEEVPPVTTTASGTTDITVRPSKCPSTASSGNCHTVTGTVWTKGLAATAAHIHQAAAGQNGPVIVTLVKVSDDVWTVPGGTVFTDDQFATYWQGLMYVNVHTDANKGGELRVQLKP